MFYPEERLSTLQPEIKQSQILVLGGIFAAVTGWLCFLLFHFLRLVLQ